MATNNLKEHETEIANAIRAKKGTSALINPQDFAKEIRNLPSGGSKHGNIASFTIDDGDYLSVNTVQQGYAKTLYIITTAVNDDGSFTVYEAQKPNPNAILNVKKNATIKFAIFIQSAGASTIVGADSTGNAGNF